MLRMLIRRLGLGGLTVFLVSVIIFAGVEMLPGDACTAYLEREAQGQRLENCRTEFGLNRPAHERYFAWASGAIQGDFGTNVTGTREIATLVSDRLKNSLMLGGLSMLVGVPLALVLGVIAGLTRDRLPDLTISTLAIFAMTIPEFVTATVLILVFSIWLNWVPGIVLTGASAPALDYFPEILLPMAVFTLVMCAHILRTVRSSVIEVLASDYVQMATLKGLPRGQIVRRHVLPNALLPVINVVALTVAWLLGGVVVIETVFNFPGLGRLMVEAIAMRDLPTVQAIALIVATIYVGVNLTADMLTMLANPRLRTLHTRRR